MNWKAQKLSYPLRYITAHLTGRPVHTYLWVLWAIGCWTLVLVTISRGNGRFAGGAAIYALIGAIAFLLFLVRFLWLLSNEEDRAWLRTVYSMADKNGTRLDARIVVRIVPFLGLIVLIEYYLFHALR